MTSSAATWRTAGVPETAYRWEGFRANVGNGSHARLGTFECRSVCLQVGGILELMAGSFVSFVCL